VDKEQNFKKLLLILVFILLIAGVAFYFLYQNQFNKNVTTTPEIAKSPTSEIKTFWSTLEKLQDKPSTFCLKDGESAKIVTESKGKYKFEAFGGFLEGSSTPIINYEDRDYRVHYGSIVKNGEEVRRFSLDPDKDTFSYGNKIHTTSCYLYLGITFSTLIEGKVTILEPKELRQYSYNGDFQIISTGDYHQINLSPSGRYLFYVEQGEPLDGSDTETKIGIFDSINNTKQETILKSSSFAGTFVQGGEYVDPVWSKDETKLWLLLDGEMESEGMISVDMKTNEFKTYSFKDTPWSTVAAFNPETGWFVGGDSRIGSLCYSEGGMYPHDWNEYFVNLFTGEKQLIGSYKNCDDGVWDENWTDNRSLTKTLPDGSKETYLISNP
jgi:hypothetical protein